MARRSSRLAYTADAPVAPAAPKLELEPEPEPEPEPEGDIEPSADEPAHPGPAAGVEVRTKFPVARIKRIMQADEDVGKVAQVTPIAVCTFTPLHVLDARAC
jgi:hypothetical protein